MKELPALPFKNLGDALKRMRIGRQETLGEVSGAVEIEADKLAVIEQGAERPSEDILLLLVAHFNVKEDAATKLWELAGYDQNQLPNAHMVNDDNGQAKTAAAVMIMPMDVRIVYTDMVHVMVNNYGVVMNFMQGAGPNNQPLAVARIGMSKEHARSVLEVLEKTLTQNEPKTLPAPGSNNQSKKNN